MRRLSWLIALGAALSGRADIVQRLESPTDLVVNQTLLQPWTQGLWACVSRGGVRLGCGQVIRSERLHAVIRLRNLPAGTALQQGDLVERLEGSALVVDAQPGDRGIRLSEGPRPWKRGDSLCFHRKGDLIACAEVTADGGEGTPAEVFWSSGVGVATGDVVRDAPGRSRLLSFDLGQGTAVIAQPRAVPWKQGETVAFIGRGLEAAWGEISQSQALTAQVRILGQQSAFDEGDWVKPAPLPPWLKQEGRGTASLATETAVVWKQTHDDLLTVGVASLFPVLRYERALLSRFALGAMPLLVRLSGGGGRLSGLGILATASYYPQGGLQGLWFQMGIGLGRLSSERAGIRGTFLSPLFASTLGRRWTWPSGMSIGLAAGALQLVRTGAPEAPLNLSGVVPLVALDLGLVF